MTDPSQEFGIFRPLQPVENPFGTRLPPMSEERLSPISRVGQPRDDAG